MSEDDDVAVTTIMYHERLTGLKRSKKKEEKFFKRFFSEVKIIPFDVKAAEESSNIAVRLMAIGREVKVLDILIAGIAVANGAGKIITRDKDFEEIAKVSDVEIVLYG